VRGFRQHLSDEIMPERDELPGIALSHVGKKETCTISQAMFLYKTWHPVSKRLCEIFHELGNLNQTH
jgi:hypothetical protein